MNQLSYIEFNLRPPFVLSVTDPDGSIARATGPTVIFSAPTDGVDRSWVLIDLHLGWSNWKILMVWSSKQQAKASADIQVNSISQWDNNWKLNICSAVLLSESQTIALWCSKLKISCFYWNVWIKISTWSKLPVTNRWVWSTFHLMSLTQLRCWFDSNDLAPSSSQTATVPSAPAAANLHPSTLWPNNETSHFKCKVVIYLPVDAIYEFICRCLKNGFAPLRKRSRVVYSDKQTNSSAV